MIFVRFLLAMLPIIWLIVAMMALKWPTWKAALGSALIAVVEALVFWHTSVHVVAMSVVEGLCMALWPIVLVIIAAVFLYNLVVKTGGMDVIKQMLMGISFDKRVLVLLVAWCFGGFMEGMAGFGTAIAIPAGMLTAMGFPALFSCLVCLMANGCPTPWGSIGIPTVTLANMVDFPTTTALSTMQVIQLAPFFMLIPILMVFMTGKMVNGKGTAAWKGMWPLMIGAGLSFIIPMLIVSRFVGAELVMIVASICSFAVCIPLAKKIKPDPLYEMKTEKKHVSVHDLLIAAAPFICVFVFLLLTSKLVAPINTWLSQFSTTVHFVNDESATTFAWVNTPGIWIFLSALIGGRIQKASWPVFGEVFKATLKQMAPSVYVMLAVLACAKVMIYSGMISDISAFAIAMTGTVYPIVAPWLGFLGTFVTGSGTTSSVLFGRVQLDAAIALNFDKYWVVGLNSLGVGAGKMVSPQSISIALAAVNKQGEDSRLLKDIMPYALAFLILMSIIAEVGSLLIHG